MDRYLHIVALLLSLTASATTAPRLQGELPYSNRYDWTSLAMGFHSTGLALADINGDGFEDMIVSNGNDLGLQPLAVYYNDRHGAFGPVPDWLSEDLDFNGMLAAGDINGDGRVDVAVAVAMDHQLNPGSGRVKVYLNRGGKLERRPSYESADEYGAISCALGDVDADGDLDLAVAVASERGDEGLGFQRIYYNRNGCLSRHPGWMSREPGLGLSVKFADVQGDGLLDLVVGTHRVQVYAASLEGSRNVTLPRSPTWSSREGLPVFFLDVGPLGPGRTPGVIASRNPIPDPTRYPEAYFEAYLPSLGSEPVWRSATPGFNSAVLLADVNKDGVLDLLAGRWGYTKTDGAPLEIYLGGASAFGTAPAFTALDRGIMETIAVADLRQLGPSDVLTSTFESDRTTAVVTLPEQHIRRIVEVRRDGRPVKRKDYTFVPGGRWLSFDEPLCPGERLEVRYVPVRIHDIAFANADCDVGNFIYYDYHVSPVGESAPASRCGGDSRCPRVPARGRLAPIRGEHTCW